ncbi:glycosyltransferase family 4 protein [Clostridium butyricum]|uniref:glycosyltransferase family 4 protein n=1 Tax=Clostridium butyricum TaxID=1492 RepID=UPI003D3507FB
MKICFITNDIFSNGGIQRVVSVLASELSKNNIVDVICLDKKTKVNRSIYNLNRNVSIYVDKNELCKNIFEKLYSKIIRIINQKTNLLRNEKLVNWLTRAYFCESLQKKFINYLNNKKYDVVIGVSGDYSLLLSIIAKQIEAKTIGWQHNSYESYFKSKYKYYWNQDKLFKKYMENLNEYIVLTDSDKRSVDNNFNINSHRIYNPVSFKSSTKSLCEEKVILFVGRLVEYQKGIDLLIEAFNKIHEKCDGWVLKIIGDGPDKNKIINRILKLDLSNKIIVEQFTSSVEKYYSNASMFVSSSRWEGFGLVVVEAMECGLPVVAFNNSGPREIIGKNGINGILVPKNDIDQLSYTILMLINNCTKRKRISKNAIERAKDFEIGKIVLEWENIIKKI